METGSPQVAIVIAAYCAEGTIERAVLSAAEQTVPVEIVVVDDASQDRTYDIAKELSAKIPCMSVIRQDANTGPAGARNTGISATKAPWITVLDSDDHMAPERIEKLLDVATNERLDLVADDIYRVQENDPTSTAKRLWKQEDFGRFEITLARFVEGNRRSRFGNRGELGFVKPLMRRSFLDANGLKYDEELRLAEDYLLYANALRSGARFHLIDPCGYFAVFREDSLSSEHSTKDLRAIVDADATLLRDPSLSHFERYKLKQHQLDVQKEWSWRRMIDAVHERDLKAMAGLFAQHPSVVGSLCLKLLEQIWLRGPKRVVNRFR